MIENIKKRDGRIVPFDSRKISQAIFKAAQAVGGSDENTADELATLVMNYLENNLHMTIPEVEQVQDAVEKVLIEEGHAKTAKAYILYRAERTKIREKNTRLMNIYKGITFDDASDNDLKRENANIDGDTAMGTMLKYGAEGAKQFNQMFVLKPSHAKAHSEGDIHIHDLDFLALTLTCCQIDILKLFKGGFSTGHGHLREPNDVQSYSALAAIAIQANQNDMHGGQSIPNFDYGIAPGVKKSFVKLYRDNMIKFFKVIDSSVDSSKLEQTLKNFIKDSEIKPEMTYNQEYYNKELSQLSSLINNEDLIKKAQKFAYDESMIEIDKKTFQAMEAFVHNLNTMHSRAGAQVPFTSINFGTDTSPEGRLVSKNLLLSTDAGLGNGETPIFPILIFKVKSGVSFNPEDPNYDLFKLSCKVSAKRLFPNFAFLDAPFNKKYYKGTPESEVVYMGCRTRVVGNIHDPEREIAYSRGNLSFTTINLPRIAIKSHGNIDKFYEELDGQIDLVIDQLLDRMEIQSKKKVKNFPFLMGQGIWLDSEKLNYEDEIKEVIKHGTLSLGFIGLAETLVALTGKHHGESESSQKLGIEIVSHFRKRLDKAAQKYKLNFTLLASPAEGTAGRFVRLDKKLFGSIKGITDKEYYTNSFHIPVSFKISAYDKIHKEAPYHEFTNAGHITYIELAGDPLKNLDAFEAIIREMAAAGVGYGSVNHPVDRDPVCCYTGVIKDNCPKCGRKDGDNGIKFERIRRITGYLVGDLSRWNNAKRSEEQDRTKHEH